MRFLPILLLALAPLAPAQPVESSQSSEAQELAKRFGIEAWDSVARLDFTFNVQSPDRQIARAWTWHPISGQISYRGPDANGNQVTVTYWREQLDGASDLVRQVDEWFINDQYWLLFPFHLVWDDGVLVADDGDQPLPLGEGQAKRLRVIFTGEGGYTPGDVYELYLSGDGLIEQWVYRRGGTGEPRPMTWEGYAHLGPLLISLEHRNPTRETRLFFTGVSGQIDNQQVEPELLGTARGAATGFTSQTPQPTSVSSPASGP